MGIFDRFKKKKPTAETVETEVEATPEVAAEPEPATQELATPDVAKEPAPTPEASAPSDVETQSQATPSPETEAENKGGFFSRFRQGLQKTTQVLNTDIRDLFKQEGQLVDEQFLDRLFEILVRTDMGASPANAIREEVQKEFRGRVVHMSNVLDRVKSKLLEFTEQEEQPIELRPQGTTIVLVVGVNGSGKTTSIAKLTKLFRDQGKSVLLGAGDTFRAAAVEQLGVWADRLGADIIKGKHGADPASVVHRTVAQAIETSVDVCIIDTAGRLQTQKNLMDELAKIRRVISKQIDDAPHDVLLVLDATAGQNAISQAKGFSEAAECTGIVLAKLDGSAKGGVVIPIRQQFNIPVRYIGVGEQPEDLALFNPQDFADALFADAERQ